MHIKRRLAVRRLRQFFERAIPGDLAQLPAENHVRALKNLRRRRKFRGQVTAHPDALSTLPGKKQRDFTHGEHLNAIRHRREREGAASQLLLIVAKKACLFLPKSSASRHEPTTYQ